MGDSLPLHLRTAAQSTNSRPNASAKQLAVFRRGTDRASRLNPKQGLRQLHGDAMVRVILETGSQRFLSAIRFGGLGIVVGIPVGLFAGAVTGGIYGLVTGMGDGTSLASSRDWLLMAGIGWGAIGSFYIAAIAGLAGGAFGGLFHHRYVGAAAGAVTGGCLGLYQGLHAPPGKVAFLFILLASGVAAGAVAGWIGGRVARASRP